MPGPSGTSDPGASASGAWRRRRLTIAAIALAALALAVRASLPYAIAWALPRGAERAGFDATVDDVDLALLRGHVTLEGLRAALRPAGVVGDASADLLRLRRLFVNVEWLALLRGELRVRELELDAPEIRLVRATDGTIVVPLPPAPSEPQPPEPAEPPAQEPAEPMPVHVERLAIRETSLRIADATGAPDLLDFALRELDFVDLRVEGTRVGLGAIRIVDPVLRARRELASTRAPAAEAGAPAEAAPAPPPELRVEDLAIEHAQFHVLTEGEPVQVTLQLVTKGVSLAPDAPFPLEFRLEAGTGSLSLRGQLGLNPVTWDGKVEWRGLAVPMAVRAALPDLVPWIRSCSAWGELDVKLRLAGSATVPAALRASGAVGVDDLSVEDPEAEVALGWKTLSIELRDATVPLGEGGEPPSLAFGAIALDAPSVRYVLPNTAVERLSGSPQAEADAPESAAAPPAEEPREGAPAPLPRITVERVEVRGGSAEFVDRSGSEPYSGRVQDLALDLEGLRIPERTVQRVRVRGIAPDRAPFDLRADLPGPRGTLHFTLERLPLAQFTPYSASAADVRIGKGELSLDVRGKLEAGGSGGEADTKVVVHQLATRAGAGAMQVAGLPLDLALALLRDPQGDIRLPVPLRWGEEGASAGIRTILLGALRAAVTGAVTSPIKAVGALLPSDAGSPVSFEPIAYAPGSAEPPPDASARLAPLAALLRDRPGLAIALIGDAGPEDRPALAERILIERVAAEQPLPRVEGAGFFERRRIQSALARRGRGEEGALDPADEPLLARYVAATEVPAERMQALAKQRAESLRELLVREHGLDPPRAIALSAPTPGGARLVTELRTAPTEPAPS